jgi:hypothetical protein
MRNRLRAIWYRYEVPVRCVDLVAFAVAAVVFWERGPRWLAYVLTGATAVELVTLPLHLGMRRRRLRRD